MERLCIIEKQIKQDLISSSFIWDRAKCIFDNLMKKNASTASGTCYDEFKASNGWFECFKKWYQIKSAIKHREAGSANVEAANKCKEFQNLVNDVG